MFYHMYPGQDPLECTIGRFICLLNNAVSVSAYLNGLGDQAFQQREQTKQLDRVLMIKERFKHIIGE